MAAGLGAQWQAAQPQVWHADVPGVDDLEPRRRERPAQLRAERRYTLNTLMVGAPLTAAFVGLMAADGGVTRGAAGSTPAEGAGTGVRTGAGAGAEPGRSTHAAEPDASVPTGSPGPLLDADGAPSAQLSGAAEPALTGDLAAFGAGIETGAVQIPAQRAPADVGAEDTGSAGPQVNLTFFGVQAFEPLEDQQTGEPAPPERGPIGIFTPGTDGDDLIVGTERDDFLIGGAGDDEIHGLGGDDILDGGVGNDRLFGGAGDDELRGGEGDDELHGGAGDDILLAGIGNDQLFGGAGRDELLGGFGDDLLDGGPGNDRMVGGPGDDILIIDNIHDVALGDGPGVAVPGNNTLVVQDAWATSLSSELGEERATFVFSENLELAQPAALAEHRQQVAGDIQNITLEGTADHDVLADSRDNVVRGNAGDNTLHGMAGDDILRGMGGDDILRGGAGDDVLFGGAGDDILDGGRGDDILRGGAGDDILKGGPGADRLFGGPGNDTYVIGLSEADATDTIFDHEGMNHIRLEGAEGHLVQTALIGDELRVIVDNNPTPLAVVDQYRGHEDAFSGIDFGDGIVPIADLLAVDVPDPADPKPDDPPGSGDDDILGEFIVGTAGDDHLFGTAGDDTIVGGKGSDLLEGGAGDDRYLFHADDFDAQDTIRDHAGENVAELQGFSGPSQLRAVETEGDLRVAVDGALLFKVEGFAGNDQAFAGVWVGETFVDTEQLLQGWQPQ